MNTEHLFGIYWGAERLRLVKQRRRASDRHDDAGAPETRTSPALEAAYQRLFDAVRAAVLESQNRP
jgi:hypothetical protein